VIDEGMRSKKNQMVLKAETINFFSNFLKNSNDFEGTIYKRVRIRELW
jgi:hypothetical protein